ncbi:hypothetical protein CGMCC3_g51 [Colletotrichum fructicola]|nr:uncharacterized protein CGMCC3_g51 [Colletotrichum fructicola]KAE9583683.1 hypothetical protein CGMCC3_g51 [Colletotrichum fructicola]
MKHSVSQKWFISTLLSGAAVRKHAKICAVLAFLIVFFFNVLAVLSSEITIRLASHKSRPEQPNSLA